MKCFLVSTLNNDENVQVLCDPSDEIFTIISITKKCRIEINNIGFENLIEAIELSVFRPDANSTLISNYPIAYN